MTTTTTTSFPCPDCTRPRRWPLTGPCRTCAGVGTVVVDQAAIRAAIVGTRGETAGQLRRSRPAIPGQRGGVYGAAFVWRMIRIHTGADMHMPVMAYDYIGVGGIIRDEDRPLLNLLDQIVADLGADLFGKGATYRGAARWGMALHGSTAPIAPGGPTYGQLATALGVRDVGAGTDIGGPDESPEAMLYG